MIRRGMVQEENVKIGAHLDTGYNVILRTNVVVGDEVKIWSNTVIDPDSVIGNNTRIHCGCYIGQGTKIGNNVFIAPNVVILNDKYPPRFDPTVWETVTIEDDVVIGLVS